MGCAISRIFSGSANAVVSLLFPAMRYEQFSEEINWNLNMKNSLLKAMVAGAGIVVAGSMGVRGDILYQDTSGYTGSALNLTNGVEVGQQLWQGTLVPEYLTSFAFEYYSPLSTYSGNVEMDVRLYENDGSLFNGYAMPDTIFFDTGYFTLTNPFVSSGNSAANINFDLSDLLTGNVVNLDPSLVMPTNFTLSVTVTGLEGSDAVGLPVFGLASVGTNAADYWLYNNISSTWELMTNNAGPVAFGAEFLGQPTPTPEPSVLCLSAIGAVALTVIARRRQRRDKI